MARSRLWLWTEGWLVENAPSWSLLSDLAAVHAAQDARGVPDASMPIANGCLFLDAVDEQSIWIDGAPPAVPRAIADFRAGLEQAVAAANGLPLHVLILPMWFHCTDAAHAELIALAKQPDASRFGRGLAQRRLIELCRELRLPVMDATAWLEAAGDTRSSWVSDKGHLSARGHRIVADNLARELASLWR